ncbi:helix-turn-helix domain-containing protein [uncultured Tateyamaria sp.]|uniref:ArsR/SmtB family transcription factor n=1 Tax=uncultured Tateyamaria sp. TaxID=455651 RepID=UPI00260D0718|nr:helix-turn-helix domain-containing protein [uncultured Tateyamaria sp.]
MDDLFKALADPARRTLLDALRDRDGQSLQQLQGLLDMTRFGVMKHLGVLEEAGLITTKKVGRFKHHYLNALPLQEAIDRWIDPYRVKPAARAVLTLKAQLEDEGDPEMSKPDFVMETYIKTTQDRLWDALSDEKNVAHYHFMCSHASRDGDRTTLHLPDGTALMSQVMLKSDPKSRMEMTFEPNWEGGGAPSRVVYLMRPEGAFVRLTIEHYDLTFPVVHGEGVADGWVRWAAGLKTWLETGEDTHIGPMADVEG